MSQTQYVGAPQGAIWGYDPTTKLWLPIGSSPKLLGPDGEEYGSLLVWVSNANQNGQKTSPNSAPVTFASDQAVVGNPLVVEESAFAATRQSLSYSVSTSDVAVTAAAAYMAVSLWNPVGSGKTLYVERVYGGYSVTANHPVYFLTKQTSDPSAGWTTPVPLTPVNLDFGSANVSVATVNRTSAANAASIVGTQFGVQDTGASVNAELLGPGSSEDAKCSPGTGLTVYVNVLNTSHFGLALVWSEY